MERLGTVKVKTKNKSGDKNTQGIMSRGTNEVVPSKLSLCYLLTHTHTHIIAVRHTERHRETHRETNRETSHTHTLTHTSAVRHTERHHTITISCTVTMHTCV